MLQDILTHRLLSLPSSLSSLPRLLQDDLWVIIKGKVYDVTSYVDEHPGGESILKNAGKDSTVGFHGPQHPSRVFQIIEDFLIGELIESDKDK